MASLAVNTTGEAVLTGDYASAQLLPTSTPMLTLGNVSLAGGSVYDEIYAVSYDAQGYLLWANHTLGQGLAGTYCAGTDLSVPSYPSCYAMVGFAK